MKELKFEELTVRQKLGMVFTPFLNSWVKSENDEEFVFQLIKERALGSVWIQQGYRDAEKMLERVQKTADYPILIMTDVESGINDLLVGRHGAIGSTGSEESAYAFGKVVGTTARKMGYNMLCSPIVDLKAGFVRSLGTDKEKVSSLAVAIAKGLHDGGTLTIAKHYPGGDDPEDIDTHMTEGVCYNTVDELKNYHLYPYRRLMEEGLLDGLMTGHRKYMNIDSKRPASLSKPMIDIIRDMGFDGYIITDALLMMGIKANYSDVESKGYSIAAGNDSILPFVKENKQAFEELCEAYDQGLIPDEALDAAVKRVLNTQHKALFMKYDTEISEKEMNTFMNISKDGVFGKTDDGVPMEISKDGKHYFAVMITNDARIGNDGKADVDTFSSKWYYPDKIEAKIKELFPNSTMRLFYEYPRQGQIIDILNESLGCDEVVFLTYAEPIAYCGKEHLTQRLKNLLTSMQHTNRISTIVHLGNPLALEEAPHFSRCIIGGISDKSVEACLEVLAGKYPAKGVLTCKVNLK